MKKDELVFNVKGTIKIIKPTNPMTISFVDKGSPVVTLAVEGKEFVVYIEEGYTVSEAAEVFLEIVQEMFSAYKD